MQNKKFVELSLAEQAHAKHIFIQLVQPGEGSYDIRRVATRDEVGEEKLVISCKAC